MYSHLMHNLHLQRIRLEFEYLDIKPDDMCMYDNLTLYDGIDGNSPIIAVLCGYQPLLPQTSFVSTGPALFISFLTDSSKEFYGFVAHVNMLYRDDGKKFT